MIICIVGIMVFVIAMSKVLYEQFREIDDLQICVKNMQNRIETLEKVSTEQHDDLCMMAEKIKNPLDHKI